MNYFATSFASGLKTRVIKLVQNEKDPEAAGGQSNRALQGLHLTPTYSFSLSEELYISLHTMERMRSTGLWSTKPASLPAPEAVQKAVAAGVLC